MLGLGGWRSIGLALDRVLLTWVSMAMPQAESDDDLRV